MKTGFVRPWIALALAGAVVAAQAAQPQPMAGRSAAMGIIADNGVRAEFLTEDFLSAHPDLRWRREALAAYQEQYYARALKLFKRAASFSDKPSQAAIAEMYWTGTGMSADRPMAYAWSDLAAERLSPGLVAVRERYWRELNASERTSAIERGQALLAEYGDDVAKPRLGRVLRRNSGKMTGSRLGVIGNLQILPRRAPRAGNGMTFRGDEYYASKYWEPDEYFQLQNAAWGGPPPATGKVKVGEPEAAPSTDGN